MPDQDAADADRQTDEDPGTERPRTDAVDTDRIALTASVTDLGDGLVVEEAVTDDGATIFWLRDTTRPPGGHWHPDIAPHEVLGPLTRGLRELVGCRCVATKRNGDPCRNLVALAGARCWSHREKP